MRFISEPEFRARLIEVCDAWIEMNGGVGPSFVVGPGRSGAIASAYASHHFGVPFVPYRMATDKPGVLVVDTARMSGRTLRKASRVYGGANTLYFFEEPPHVRFWYEELSYVRGKRNEYHSRIIRD